MTPSPFDKQTASSNSLHNQLISVYLDFVTLCGRYVEVEMSPMDAIWLFSVIPSTPIGILVAINMLLKSI